MFVWFIDFFYFIIIFFSSTYEPKYGDGLLFFVFFYLFYCLFLIFQKKKKIHQQKAKLQEQRKIKRSISLTNGFIFRLPSITISYPFFFFFTISDFKLKKKKIILLKKATKGMVGVKKLGQKEVAEKLRETPPPKEKEQKPTENKGIIYIME